MTESVYFVECAGRIKIGFSKSVAARIAALQISAPSKLTIVAVVGGDVGVERAFHKLLSPFRATGEWFEDCCEVRSAIEAYQRQGIASLGQHYRAAPARPRPEAFVPPSLDLVFGDGWEAMSRRFQATQSSLGAAATQLLALKNAGADRERVRAIFASIKRVAADQARAIETIDDAADMPEDAAIGPAQVCEPIVAACEAGVAQVLAGIRSLAGVEHAQ